MPELSAAARWQRHREICLICTWTPYDPCSVGAVLSREMIAALAER